MKLIITRHGETKENNADIIQGHLPGHLSDIGIQQAKKVALRLQNEKIDFIYSSDLARAADTAKEIANYHPHVPLKFVKDLRERFMGAWQGKTRKELGLINNNKPSFPADMETDEELFNRADNFLHKILKRHQNDTVLFVAHNRINTAIIAAITGKTAIDLQSMERLHNTSVSIFEINQNKNHKVHILNCVEHLN